MDIYIFPFFSKSHFNQRKVTNFKIFIQFEAFLGILNLYQEKVIFYIKNPYV